MHIDPLAALKKRRRVLDGLLFIELAVTFGCAAVPLAE